MTKIQESTKGKPIKIKSVKSGFFIKSKRGLVFSVLLAGCVISYGFLVKMNDLTEKRILLKMLNSVPKNIFDLPGFSEAVFNLPGNPVSLEQIFAYNGVDSKSLREFSNLVKKYIDGMPKDQVTPEMQKFLQVYNGSYAGNPCGLTRGGIIKLSIGFGIFVGVFFLMSLYVAIGYRTESESNYLRFKQSLGEFHKQEAAKKVTDPKESDLKESAIPTKSSAKIPSKISLNPVIVEPVVEIASELSIRRPNDDSAEIPNSALENLIFDGVLIHTCTGSKSKVSIA